MSRSAQRKRDAYTKGYRAGRHGLWDAPYYRFGAAAGKEFDRGRSDGRRDRAAAMREETARRTWWGRALVWLAGRFS